jgi:hypothetical protein
MTGCEHSCQVRRGLGDDTFKPGQSEYDPIIAYLTNPVEH